MNRLPGKKISPNSNARRLDCGCIWGPCKCGYPFTYLRCKVHEKEYKEKQAREWEKRSFMGRRVSPAVTVLVLSLMGGLSFGIVWILGYMIYMAFFR